jgi:hypothetical protein
MKAMSCPCIFRIGFGTSVSLTGWGDSNHHHGGETMSASGIAVFDKTLQTTHTWLDDLMADQGLDRQLAWHVLGAVLHVSENDFGNARYDGPQPPKGHGLHHYQFRLAALDVPNIKVPDRAGIEAMWKEARSHILSETTLTGTFDVHQTQEERS